MKRSTRKSTARSKVPAISRAAPPRSKRDIETIDKALAETGDPFAVFSEWSSETDEKAYAGL